MTPLPGRYTPPPVPPPLPGPRPDPVPGPMPVPEPVPDPPPLPEPCDKVGGPGGASIAPGSVSVADANSLAGILTCAIGGGSFLTSFVSRDGGLATGTVI